MKIVIPGGSGQVGSILRRSFVQDGHDVTILSRNPVSTDGSWKSMKWDGETLDEWITEIEGSDVVINLAGKNVNCRYTEENQVKMMDSRVNSTRIIGEAINKVENPPHTWLQASTATIYAHRFDEPNDEYTGLIGGSEQAIDRPDKWQFSVDIAKAWEKTLDNAEVSSTRKVKMRTSLVMSPDKGGIFDTLLSLVRWGLGGKAGSGKQYVSWIHVEDFVQVVKWLIENEEIDDVINITAPNPLPYSEFMKYIREAWGRSIGLPATKWMLEIAAFFMRTETELILKSRRVVPKRLIDENFTFKFNDWQEASNDLVHQYKNQ